MKVRPQLIRDTILVTATAATVVALQGISTLPKVWAGPKQDAVSEIAAKRISIVDDNGKKRIDLRVDRDGPVLELLDDKTKAGIAVWIGSGPGTQTNPTTPQPHLELRGPSGSGDVAMRSSTQPETMESVGGIGVSSSNDTGSITMGIRPRGESSIELSGEEGKGSILLRHRPDAGPCFFCYDNNRKIRMIFGLNTKLDKYFLDFDDANGKPVWHAFDDKVKKEISP